MMIKGLTLSGKYFIILIHIYYQQLCKVVIIIIPTGQMRKLCEREMWSQNSNTDFMLLTNMSFCLTSPRILLLKEEGSGKIPTHYRSYNYNPSISIMQTIYLNLNKTVESFNCILLESFQVLTEANIWSWF